MPYQHSIALTTRTSDLDSLRHVNNKVYEQLCAEGRCRLLAEQGHSLETMLEQAVVLRPLATFVKFSLQQKAGATLTIDTQAFPLGDGLMLWDHHLRQPDGKTVCHLQAKTQTLDRQQRPIELLPALGEDPPPVLIENVPAFAGGCARLTSAYAASYTDMDVFGSIPIAAYWRIFEEGRHLFAEQLGLTRERLVQLDTHLFWGGGTYQFYQPLRARPAPAPPHLARAHRAHPRLHPSGNLVS